MEISCTQMDILLSFYIDGELTDTLKEKVEEHLNNCSSCRAKYHILSSLFKDIRNEEDVSEDTDYERGYDMFRENLSAYVDNELSEDENIKIKKYTINNKRARKDLEDAYRIRKLMRDSFRKTKEESKSDFARNVLKQLNLTGKQNLSFNPLIKVGFAFMMTVLFLSTIIVFSLSF